MPSLIDDFTPLAGDRKFGEDAAIVGGFGRFRGESVCVIGHEKGTDTESRLKHNFGMARPEGYRKAVRIMDIADRFDLPVIALVDTAGAYPGIGAEERGQAEAIARSTEACLNRRAQCRRDHRRRRLGRRHRDRDRQPGAHAGARDLQRDLAGRRRFHPLARYRRAQDAASSMKITAQDLLRFGVIDSIMPEPIGGAHRDPAATIAAAGDAIAEALAELHGLDPATIVRQRREKFLAIGRTLVIVASWQRSPRPASVRHNRAGLPPEPDRCRRHGDKILALPVKFAKIYHSFSGGMVNFHAHVPACLAKATS